MVETWRDIAGYEGIYQVSNHGRVKTRKKIKTPQKNNRGYMTIMLYKNDGGRHFLIHRLVAQAFIPNPENKATVNHKDGVRSNNKLDNLEWATYNENNLHMYKNGRKSALANPIQCIETGKTYDSSYEASRDTGISQSSINRCANGTYKQTKGTHWVLLNKRKENII